MLDGLTITGITLTPEACSDILETALEGHTCWFGYWGDLLSVVAHDASVDGRSAVRYKAITVKEWDGGRQYTVTVSKVQKAVLAMLRDPKACACRGLLSQLLDDSGLDGPLAEAIVQVACFGEVIYG